MHTPIRCPNCGRIRPCDSRAQVCPVCELEGALSCFPGNSGLEHLSEWDAIQMGDYELLEEIGRGGMGVVYRARQVSLDRIVAVKVILHGFFADSEAPVRIQKEAQMAARLHHPNIVAIHEVGEFQGRPFFSMDYVEGQTLENRVHGQPQTPQGAAQCLILIADAVEYAHSHGVIHRDLKPANILVDALGNPTIADFGIAKVMDPGGDPTVSHQFLGSPNYMSPEQAREEASAAGPAMDIYSMGGILYYLLTGRPPFIGGTLSDLLGQLNKADPVAPRLINPSIPKDLETICLKCLQKEPSRRYRSAGELREELRRFLVGRPIHARPVGRSEKLLRWCRREPALAGLLGATWLSLALGIAGSTWQWRRAERRGLEARRSLYAADMLLAFQAYEDCNFGKVEQLLQQHDPRGNETLPEDLRGWEWHHLAQQIQGDELFTLGSSSATVNYLVFSPDGRTLASTSHYLLGNVITLWDYHRRKAIKTINASHLAKGMTVAFSPDGEDFAVGDDRTLSVYGAPEFSLAHEPLVFPMRIGAVAYAPGGESLAVMETGGSIAEADSGGLHFLDPATLDSIGTLPTGSGRGLAFSPDGRFIAVMMRHAEAVVVWDRELHAPVAELNGPGSFYRYGNLTFSQDGRFLAVVTGTINRESGRVDIWSCPDFEKLQSFDREDIGFAGVAFSQDSRRVFLAGTDQRISVQDVISGEQVDTLVGHRDEVWSIAVSPDGEWLASGSRDETIRVWSTDSGLRVPDSLPMPSSTQMLCMADDGTAVAAVSSNQTVQVWSTASGSVLAEHPLPPCDLYRWSNNEWQQIALASQGSAIAMGSGTHFNEEMATKVLSIWTLPSMDEQRQFPGLMTWACGLAISPDNRTLAASGFFGENRALLWDIQSGEILQEIPDLPGRSGLLKFSPRQNFLAIRLDRDFTWGWEVKLWDLSRAKPAQLLSRPKHRIIDMAFSPDEHWFATAGDDGTLGIWEVGTGRFARALSGPLTSFTCAAWSPDGKRLVGGGEDGTLTIWETASYRQVGRIPGHSDRVFDVAFLRETNTIISIGRDALRFWRSEIPTIP